MSKKLSPKTAQPVQVEATSTYDGPHAAIVLVERVLAYAHSDGMVSVTVGAHRVFPHPTDQMAADLMVTGYLKLTLKGAAQLKAALTTAMLLSEQTKGAPN
jgi:hypothetical protein